MSSILLALSTSYTKELVAKRARLDQLIGEKHWLTVGTYKEALVRGLLRERLPRRLEVGTGFVVARDGEKREMSRQLDVLVWDSSEHMPLFRDGEFVVIVPEACVAAIEVKGNLTKTELRDAIENLDSIARCFAATFGAGTAPPSPPMRAILGFKAHKAVHVPTILLDELQTYYSRDTRIPLANRLAYSREQFNDAWSLPWINSVVVLGQGGVVLEGWAINGGVDEPVYAAYDTVGKDDDSYGFLERQIMQRALADRTGRLYDKPGARALLFGPERLFPRKRWMRVSGAGGPVTAIGRYTPADVAIIAPQLYTATAPKKRAKKGAKKAAKKAATKTPRKRAKKGAK